jgi:hypothetical protein
MKHVTNNFVTPHRSEIWIEISLDEVVVDRIKPHQYYDWCQHAPRDIILNHEAKYVYGDGSSVPYVRVKAGRRTSDDN